jgi:hypothetical protein
MVREDEVDAAHETDSKCEDRPLTHADRGSHELGATDGPAD